MDILYAIHTYILNGSLNIYFWVIPYEYQYSCVMSSALIGYGHICLYYMWTLRIKYHIQHVWVLWDIYDSTKYGPFKVNYSIFFNCEINFYGFPTWGLEQLIVTLISLSGRDLHSYDTTIKYFTKCFEVVNSSNGIIHFQIQPFLKHLHWCILLSSVHCLV